MDRIHKILEYWFEGVTDEDVIDADSAVMQKWFGGSVEIDREIKKELGQDLIKAQKGEYDSWKKTAPGRLALVVLFDQVARNVYRGTPKAFENDLVALELCLSSIKEGFDKKLKLLERRFLYMPMMHSEHLPIQEMSLKYYQELVDRSEEEESPNLESYRNTFQFAQNHYDIIKKFRRFPHRNKILKRRSTFEEVAFLQTPGSSF